METDGKQGQIGRREFLKRYFPYIFVFLSGLGMMACGVAGDLERDLRQLERENRPTKEHNKNKR